MKNFDQFSFKRIIIVAYRLPFKLVRKKEEYYPVQNSGGLVSAILSLSEKMNSANNSSPKILWVGTGEKQLGDVTIHQNFKLHPVELPRKINEKYYQGFCNNTIWPLFHYFPSRTVYDNSYFDAYITANNLFSQELRKLVQPGDLIWIHDYQLFLLPEMVRNIFPEANIGFFLHIPFPSYELFRLLPRKWREMILSGMSGADIVGFHTNDYTTHFIKSVKRTLGFKVERHFISVRERLCKADAFPIGVDFDKFQDACYSPKTIVHSNKLQKSLSGNKLIFSIDRLDYSKGFLYRLKAYERFLEKYPEWHFKVMFNMIVIPSRDKIESYREIKKEIEATVGRVNGKYSTLNWRPLVYQYKSIPFNELVAIYNISDVGFITPLRDGMNLVAKEYVACQNERYGMLVLSEMAGAAVELNESIIINPTDIEETSDALNKALCMPDEEKENRMMKMQNRLSRYNVFTWTTDFFNQVADVKKEQKYMQAKYIDINVLKSIRLKYDNSQNRIFLIDYDGTLTPIARLPEMAVLQQQTKSILRNIVTEKRNKVVITNLDAILVAEHGYFIRYPDTEWEKSVELDLSWKKKIKPVINDYVDRCNGSMMEEKDASIVWHYRNADEEIASLRINELKDDLSEILKSEPKLFVLEGDKVLEVKSILYDKGTVASNLLNKEKFDFILALGDDSTDEDLFKVIPDYGFTIKVGIKPTNARFNIRNQSQIFEILNLFTGSAVTSLK
jgi:trehalose 6-phosphate synthase/phosphatase